MGRVKAAARLNALGTLFHDFDIDELETNPQEGKQTFADVRQNERLSGRHKRALEFAGEGEAAFGQVRDAQGRVRFHGAFTGGFSAGYYNTVGSQEGWAPTDFRSSRQNRALQANQNLATYADEEDLAGLMARETLPAPAASLAIAMEETLQTVIEDRPSAGISLYHLLGGLSNEGESDRALRFLSARSRAGRKAEVMPSTNIPPESELPRRIGPQVPAEFLQKLKEEGTTPEEEDRLSRFRSGVSRACLKAFLFYLRHPHIGRGGVGCSQGEEALPVSRHDESMQEKAIVSFDASILPIKERALAIRGEGSLAIQAAHRRRPPEETELALISTIQEHGPRRIEMKRAGGKGRLDHTGRLHGSINRGRPRGTNHFGSSLSRQKNFLEHEEVDILDIDDEVEEYDFEQKDPMQSRADESDTEVERDVVASLAAKIELMERSKQSIPDWTVSVNGVAKLLNDFDWATLRGYSSVAPRGFRARVKPQTKTESPRQSVMWSVGNTTAVTSQLNLQIAFADRFVGPSDSQTVAVLAEKLEAFPPKRFTSSFLVNSQLCRLLQIRQPVRIQALEDTGGMRVQIARYFQTLKLNPAYPLSKSLPQMTGVIAPALPEGRTGEDPVKTGRGSTAEKEVISSEERSRKHMEAVMAIFDLSD